MLRSSAKRSERRDASGGSGGAWGSGTSAGGSPPEPHPAPHPPPASPCAPAGRLERRAQSHEVHRSLDLVRRITTRSAVLPWVIVLSHRGTQNCGSRQPARRWEQHPRSRRAGGAERGAHLRCCRRAGHATAPAPAAAALLVVVRSVRGRAGGRLGPGGGEGDGDGHGLLLQRLRHLLVLPLLRATQTKHQTPNQPGWGDNSVHE